MTRVLMISMDATLLTGAIGNARARHEDYARRTGALDIVVCNVPGRGKSLDPIDTGALQIRPTNSARRPAYLLDGYRAALHMTECCRPDVITTQDPFITGLIGLRLRRVLHAPLIVQNQSSVIDTPAFAQERRLNRVLQLLARQVVRRADAVRVVNHDERDACIRLGVPANRVQVIPVPVTMDRFAQPDTRIDWRARLGLTAQDRIVLWVGRPVPVKNLALLLNAFKIVSDRMPEARLVLTGAIAGTPYPARIEQLGLQSVVRLPGAVTHADLPSLYQATDVLALTSAYEGFGLVLIEAAAAGIPSVAVATAGPREIIRDGETGILIPADRLGQADPDRIAAALLGLLRDPARARTMGARARMDVMQRFDPARITADWVGLWQSVSEAGRG